VWVYGVAITGAWFHEEDQVKKGRKGC
jgi:hypothetical protein